MSTMQVEVLYDQQVNAHPEVSEEVIKLLEEMGLNEQLKFYNKETKEIEFPFREFNKEELSVYRYCFPRSSKLEEFNMEVIPLRVLEVIKKAKDCNKFMSIKIWHKEPGRIKEDPIAVGCIKEGYTYKFYPLARWGDALLSYAELKKQALEIFKLNAETALTEILGQVKLNLEKVKSGKIADMVGWDDNPRPADCSFTGYF